MNLQEWSIIIFTILGQMAAGAMLTLMVVRTYLASRTSTQEVDAMLDGPTFIVVPVMGVALLASLTHLNNIVNVVRAVPNLGTSWLSREVVVAVVFVVLAIVYTFMQWRKVSSNAVRTIIGWITALMGVALVYSMSKVYMVRTQPAWNNFATPSSFAVTALLLGALAVAVGMIVVNSRLEQKDSAAAEKRQAFLRPVMQGIALWSVILLGVEFLIIPLFMGYLATQGTAAAGTLNLLLGPFLQTLMLRLILVFAGAGILGTYLFHNAGVPGKGKTVATLTYSVFVLVLLGEVMGRILFYATNIRVGL